MDGDWDWPGVVYIGELDYQATQLKHTHIAD
jgi:hypothetical protein